MSNTDSLIKLIRDTGQDWILDSFGSPQDAIQEIRATLSRAGKVYVTKFPGQEFSNVPSLTEEQVIREHELNPHRAEAFVQALGSSSNPEMLVMVWRVLYGDSIRSLSLNYHYNQKFTLHVELEDSFSGETNAYDSDDIDDAALVRHLGILKLGESPVFEGFYPLAGPHGVNT